MVFFIGNGNLEKKLFCRIVEVVEDVGRVGYGLSDRVVI